MAMPEMPQFAEMPEAMRNMIKTSIEQTKKAFDTFLSASEKGMQSLYMSSGATPSSVRALNEKFAEFTKANAEANFRLAMRLADARQVSDVIEMQNAHMREQMSTYTRQFEEIRELTARVMKESAQNVGSTMPNMPGMGR